jgi:hypothetical protein
MWKTVLAGTAAIAIAGTTLAFAQQGPGFRDHAHRWRPSAQDMAAFSDARIAALHAGLKLTPDQEKNWPAMEAALRDLAKQRSERFAARASADKPKTPIERLELRAQAMSDRGAALKKLADAADPLYNSLDEAQKHRFMVLAWLTRPHADGWRGRHGGQGAEHRRWMMHREGFDPMAPGSGPKPQ